LTAAGKFSSENLAEYRTRLRKAGYIFIPLKEDELAFHLDASTVKEGKVVETAELKAIRENILCIRMSTWLQLPKEALWLDGLLKTFIRVLKGLWKAGADLPEVRARSNWILDQIDVRCWAHCLGGENGDNLVKVGRSVFIQLLIFPPENTLPEVKNEYWKWLEDMVLAPIKEQEPELYNLIIAGWRKQIADAATMDLNEDGQNDE